MTWKYRRTLTEPITPVRDGRAPTWIVSCPVCGFRHDAHGASKADAIREVKHEPSHPLDATPVDYATGWGQNGAESHPLYPGG